jgi:hypothetical protein
VSKEKGTASRLAGDVIVGSLSASSGSRKSSDQHMTGSTSLPLTVTANPYETFEWRVAVLSHCIKTLLHGQINIVQQFNVPRLIRLPP